MMGLRSNTPHRTRCDYCHHQTDYPYAVQIEGLTYHFCGGAHARAAEANFKEKVNKNITPNFREEVITNEDSE